MLENAVIEIEMKEQQFWSFAQPIAEKPWVTFMGPPIRMPDMRAEAQKYLGIFDGPNSGAI